MDDYDDLPEWMHRVKVRVDRVQPRSVRRIGVAVIGATVLLLGIVMVVLPGPAILVIPAGLAILALEFRWARRWLKKARGFAAQVNPRRNRAAQATEHKARLSEEDQQAINLMSAASGGEKPRP